MTPLATALWLANLFFDTAGQLSFKAASVKAGEADGLDRWLGLAKTPFLWLGILSFVAEFFLWLAFLSMVPLAQGVLVGCINIIGIMIGGRFFFGEKITRARVCAIACVAAGVFLVGWSGA